MNDEIAASITIGGASEPIASETYKVRDYADVILANQDNKFSDELIILVKTMLNYGTSAQIQFVHNLENVRLATMWIMTSFEKLTKTSSLPSTLMFPIRTPCVRHSTARGSSITATACS